VKLLIVSFELLNDRAVLLRGESIGGEQGNGGQANPRVLSLRLCVKVGSASLEVLPAGGSGECLDALYEIILRRVGIEVGDAFDSGVDISDLNDRRVTVPELQMVQAEKTLEDVSYLLLHLCVKVNKLVGILGDNNDVRMGAIPEVVAEDDLLVTLHPGKDALNDEVQTLIGDKWQTLLCPEAELIH